MEGWRMKNIETICREVADGVREEIRQAITEGCDSASYEKEYGGGVIVVDVRAYGSMMVYAVVGHQDGRHRSPRIEQAIENAVPDWYSVERDVAEELRYSLMDEEIAMRLC